MLKKLSKILLLLCLFTTLTFMAPESAASSDDEPVVEAAPGEHVEHGDHGNEIFSSTDLNPHIRMDQLRLKRYPQLYNLSTEPTSLSPQSAAADNYYLPISAPNTTYVTQSYFGPYSHQNSRAIDFFGSNMVVAAARKGVIISLKEGGKWDRWCNSYQNCADQGGIWNGNHILVQHSDGSYAFYIHMKAGTIRNNLQVGTPVQRGTVLGDVGATGYTCGNSSCTIPGEHLHFQVNLNSGTTLVTPFEDCKLAINNCSSQNIPLANNRYTTNNYPAAARNFDGKPDAIYLLGSQLAIRANRLANLATLGLSSQIDANSEIALQNNRLEAKNNYCITAVNSVAVRLVQCDSSNSQKWSKFGRYQLRSTSTGSCLQNNGNRTSGSLVLSACRQTDSQYFRLSQEFIPISPVTPIN